MSGLYGSGCGKYVLFRSSIIRALPEKVDDSDCDGGDVWSIFSDGEVGVGVGVVVDTKWIGCISSFSVGVV